MTRRAITGWFLVHKWSSLVCTAFLLMLCVTGLPLIFHDEIDAALSPVQPLSPVPAGTRLLDLDRLVAHVPPSSTAAPGKFLRGLDIKQTLFRVGSDACEAMTASFRSCTSST